MIKIKLPKKMVGTWGRRWMIRKSKDPFKL
jgi:hypothetical protein